MLLRRLVVKRAFVFQRTRWNSGGPVIPPGTPSSEPQKAQKPLDDSAIVEPKLREETTRPAEDSNFAEDSSEDPNSMEAHMMEMAREELGSELQDQFSEEASEQDEDAVQNAIRQAMEETGLSEDDFLQIPQAWKDVQPEKPASSEEEMFTPDTQREPESFLDEKLEPNETEAATSNPSEEQYAAALVHGRSFHAPFKHPQTDNIPVAIIQFRSYHTHLLDLFTHFASHAAASLAIPISGVIMLPKKRSLWTVPRSPFVFKKSQENFERIEHKRAIKAWDADEEVFCVEPEAVKEAAPDVADTALHTESGEEIRTLGEKIVREEMSDKGKKVIKDAQ
ncbi:hypothetical protein BDZ89DRAFT_1155444 [Hymenopellis radicata]|nr:hypothetical protein BDZ89DRAFT_1155444 [Hymenopellis radicata]